MGLVLLAPVGLLFGFHAWAPIAGARSQLATVSYLGKGTFMQSLLLATAILLRFGWPALVRFGSSRHFKLFVDVAGVVLFFVDLKLDSVVRRHIKNLGHAECHHGRRHVSLYVRRQRNVRGVQLNVCPHGRRSRR